MSTSTPSPPEQAPAADELVRRAAELYDQLAADAGEADRERRLTDRTAEAVTEAGLLRMMVPRRYGGYQSDVRALMEVTEELGRACGSTAWVVGILNAGAWLAGTFPEEAQNEVWGENPMNRVAGVLAPSAEVEHVDGGMVVTGRWGFASGCHHCEWTVAGVPLSQDPDAPPENGLILLPMSEVEIEDTWFVAGMRGTASNTLVTNETFVPEHRIISMPKALRGEYRTEHKDEALYRASLPGVLMLAAAGPQVGMARAALDIVLEKAPRRAVSSTFYETQTESVAFQLGVAEAATKVDTARMHGIRAAEDVDRAAELGGLPEPLVRARVRMDSGWVSQQCREAIDLLMTAHGTAAFGDVSPLQRIWRDQETASRHAIIASEVCKEIYGKQLLGVEPQISHLV